MNVEWQGTRTGGMLMVCETAGAAVVVGAAAATAAMADMAADMAALDVCGGLDSLAPMLELCAAEVWFAAAVVSGLWVGVPPGHPTPGTTRS